ncbi:MAG: hypothetical protein R3C44_10455 [Chloroflexota bacterium]
MNPSTNDRHFDRGAWATLILPSALLIFAVVMLVYRFTLPTDGWFSEQPDDLDATGYVYKTNIMGAPSDLQPGDYLVGVNGFPLTDSMSMLWPVREDWQVGNTVRYAARRGDETLEFDVPLVRWNLSSYWRGQGRSVTDIIGFAGLIAFLGVALLAFWRSPANPAARALWVMAAVIFTSFVVGDLLPFTIADVVDPLSSSTQSAFIGALFTVLLPPALIRFALVFPKPSALLQKWPWLAWAPYLIGLLALVAFVRKAYIFTWGWMAAGVVIAVGILIYNAVTSHDAVSRAQLRWGWVVWSLDWPFSSCQPFPGFSSMYPIGYRAFWIYSAHSALGSWASRWGSLSCVTGCLILTSSSGAPPPTPS